MRTRKIWGGTLNIIRHCLVARKAGADAVIATETGVDRYDFIGSVGHLPLIRWQDRKPDDVCLIPDVLSWLIDQHQGPCISYQQVPGQIKNNFDHARENVRIWTDSDLMLSLCEKAYPGKDIPIVPNVVDHRAFPFIPQAQRMPGELIAFPRKGPEFIEESFGIYRQQGGKYWNLHLIDGLPFNELAQRFTTPQAFLASADVEGCALPPQESMAAGLVVIGKDANGANFCMQHEKTALVTRTPEETAEALFRAEDLALREELAANAYKFISRFFEDGEPLLFWRDVLRSYRDGEFASVGRQKS